MIGRAKPFYDTTKFYNKCQLWDSIPGTGYDGTTIRAGAKILNKLGLVEEYRWAKSVEEVIMAVTHLGPMVVGTYWYENMNTPTSHRHILRPTGKRIGGHAYLINGVDRDKEMFRIKNSWGTKWGDEGHAYISFDNFEKLFGQMSEACIAFEAKANTVPLLEGLKDPS